MANLERREKNRKRRRDGSKGWEIEVTEKRVDEKEKENMNDEGHEKKANKRRKRKMEREK